MYDVFYSFNILNTSFNIGFCITVKRLEQSWFVRYINVYYYYYYYYPCSRTTRLLLQPDQGPTRLQAQHHHHPQTTPYRTAEEGPRRNRSTRILPEEQPCHQPEGRRIPRDQPREEPPVETGLPLETEQEDHHPSRPRRPIPLLRPCVPPPRGNRPRRLQEVGPQHESLCQRSDQGCRSLPDPPLADCGSWPCSHARRRTRRLCRSP